MALTQDKAKAKELRKEVKAKLGEAGQVQESDEINNISQQFPTADELAELKTKYKSLFKISQDHANVGKVLQFRVVEANERYFICKSLDAEKKSKNIVAVLPRSLVGKYFIHTVGLEEQVFEGLVLEIQEDAFPIISVQHDLISLKESIPSSNEHIQSTSSTSFLGFVASVDRRGVTLGFIDGLRKLILVKDLETV